MKEIERDKEREKERQIERIRERESFQFSQSLHMLAVCADLLRAELT